MLTLRYVRIFTRCVCEHVLLMNAVFINKSKFLNVCIRWKYNAISVQEIRTVIPKILKAWHVGD
jgi:hypothetical protein